MKNGTNIEKADAQALALDSAAQGRVIESLVLRGDLSGLAPKDRARYYVSQCEQLGLNPNSQPFAFLRLNGKEILYATRGATDQLAAIHRLNREIIDGPKVVDIAGTKVVYCVAKATHPNGRTETATATLPCADPANVYMKAETKAKRRVTLSILGLGMLDEMEVESIPANVKEAGGGVDLALAYDDTPAARTPVRVDLDALGVEQPRRVLDAPAVSSWSADLAACSTLADVRACYAAHRTPDTDGAAMVADVRGWCSAQGVYLDAAGVTAALSTLPLDALRCLDAGRGTESAIVAAGRTCRAAGWPEHATRTVWSALARGYAEVTGARSVKVAAEALRAACEEPTPPTGTDGPAKPANEVATAEGTPVASTGADGATASIVDQIATAWSMSAPGIVEHVRAITSARHLEASGRAHLRAISQGLRTHAIHAYADRLVMLSRREEHDDEGHRVVSEMPKDEAVSRVERWLREGPRVQVAAKVKRAA